MVVGDPGGVLPDTIVVDHGKIYLSEHTRAVCERLGISIQPAIPDKPTDKPALERFFRTLRQSLLEHLPGYKGPDVAARGKDVEGEAFYYVDRAGAADPRVGGPGLPPHRARRAGRPAGTVRWRCRRRRCSNAGSPPPAGSGFRPGRTWSIDFLEVEWRTIQHYGVEIDGQRYDGPGLNDYRGTRSPYGGAHPGKWPFMVDRDDIRTVYFRDPATGAWHRLEWEHAAADRRPVLRRRRRLRPRHRRQDPPPRRPAAGGRRTCWPTGRPVRSPPAGTGTSPSGSPPNAPPPAGRPATRGTTDRDTASTPGVVDLLARRDRQAEGCRTTWTTCSPATTPPIPTPTGWRCSTNERRPAGSR